MYYTAGMKTEIMSLANPARFMEVSGRLLPVLAGVTAIAFSVAFYMCFNAPEDQLHGRTVLILFLHVPAASLSLMFYMLMAVSSLGTLVWRHPLADVSQKSAALIGAAFAFLCLVTGSLWGRPAWGTYWVWDARLTSMLILFLMYCGSIALWNAIVEPARAARAAAILNLVGVLNVFLVKFSVDFWNTQHQPASLFTSKGKQIDDALFYPLLSMIIACALFGAVIYLATMRTEILRRRARKLSILEAERLDARLG